MLLQSPTTPVDRCLTQRRTVSYRRLPPSVVYVRDYSRDTAALSTLQTLLHTCYFSPRQFRNLYFCTELIHFITFEPLQLL